MTRERSLRTDVRNPLLQLPAMRRLQALPLVERAELATLLDELATDAQARAERSWRQRKAPMAAYWRAVGVYARHTARGLISAQERRNGRRLARSLARAGVAELETANGTWRAAR